MWPIPTDDPAAWCLSVFTVKAGRSKYAITTAGTVGGLTPGLPGRSNSFISHMHPLAKKNSAVTAGETGPYAFIILHFIFAHFMLLF